jgi:hypothetical protein
MTQHISLNPQFKVFLIAVWQSLPGNIVPAFETGAHVRLSTTVVRHPLI